MDLIAVDNNNDVIIHRLNNANCITDDVTVNDDDIIINSNTTTTATYNNYKKINSIKYYIYRITDKSDSNEFYIGSTKHFASRKSKHKKNVTNKRGKNYWDYLYKYIRLKGGWKNFDMNIMECGHTDRSETIKYIEQAIINKCRPTLNTKHASSKYCINSESELQELNTSDNFQTIEKNNTFKIVSPIATKTNLVLKRNDDITEYLIKNQIEKIKEIGMKSICSKHISSENSPRKTRTRAANLEIEINEDIATQLTESTLLQFVCKSPQSKNAFVQQSIQFLSWVSNEETSTRLNKKILDLIKLIILKPNILDDWYTFLKEKRMADDTIRGRYNNISVLIQLFNSNLVNFKGNAVSKFIEHCRIITRRCEFDITNTLSKISTNDYIRQGLLPKNLKSDLLHMWKILLPLMQNIILLSKTKTLTKKFYSLFLKCLLFGFWAENANGRMNAVISMTMKQYRHMCKRNFNSSSHTKTIKQHGRQLVSLCSNSDLLVYLKLYVKHVRKDIKLDHSNKKYVFLK